MVELFAIMAIGDFMNSSKALLLGARIVMLLAAERVERSSGWVSSTPESVWRDLVLPKREFKLWASEVAERERSSGMEILSEGMNDMLKNDRMV